MVKQRTKLAKDFVILSLIVVLTLFSLCIWFSYKTYTNQSSAIIHTLEVQSSRINTAFADAIDYTAQAMWHMNQQIAANGTNQEFIDKLLESYRVPNNDIVSYSTFTWADSNHKVIVTSNQGVMPDPADLSTRDYITRTIAEPWKIHIGQPVYGVTSKQWSIPAGMGAIDSEGNYLGAIVTGFIVSALTKKLDAVINQQGVSFALFDKDGVLIAASRTIESAPNDINNFRIRLQNQQSTLQKHGTLSDFSLFNNESQFSYYQIMPKYGYSIVTVYDRELSQQTISKVILSFMMESAVIAILIILLLLTIRRLLVLPVLNLASKAETIAKGREKVSIPDYKTYEMNLLGSQLAEIQSVKIELANAHNEVSAINATLEQRVAKRTESLQEALNARNEFLNHLSHEIRTPVSSIHARSDILLEQWEEFQHDELKESIENIQTNALQVCNLVTSLLDLSKSRAGKMLYDMKSYDVAKIAEEVAEECRPLYQQKSLKLTVENKASHTIAPCDAMRIGQVIRNLLSNACRYTPRGTVHLLISNTDMHGDDGSIIPAVSVSIKDNGVGIPEGEEKHIFEAFTQSSRTNSKAGGTGLGLAISHTIIAAHHGQITAQNNKTDKGCVFWFVIPLEGVETLTIL